MKVFTLRIVVLLLYCVDVEWAKMPATPSGLVQCARAILPTRSIHTSKACVGVTKCLGCRVGKGALGFRWDCPQLARDLHRRVPVGREVPSELYRAVAEVLAFVYRVRPGRDHRRGGAL